jgi:hypothetical protein
MADDAAALLEQWRVLRRQAVALSDQLQALPQGDRRRPELDRRRGEVVGQALKVYTAYCMARIATLKEEPEAD